MLSAQLIELLHRVARTFYYFIQQSFANILASMDGDVPAVRVLQSEVAAGLAVFVESLPKKKPHQFLRGEGGELWGHGNSRKPYHKLFLIN